MAQQLIVDKKRPRIVQFRFQQESSIQLNIGNKQISVTAKDILYLGAMGNYTIIYLRNGAKGCYSKSLKQTLKRISGKDFIRIHQSYAVHRKCIQSVDRQSGNVCCQLIDQKILPVSRRKSREVTTWFRDTTSRAVKIIPFSR